MGCIVSNNFLKGVTVIIKFLTKHTECTKGFSSSQNDFCAVMPKFSIRIDRNSKLINAGLQWNSWKSIHDTQIDTKCDSRD